MKLSTFTTIVCLSATYLVAGCGGATPDATIGGTVVGLSGGTTVGLLNNGSDQITVGANGTFNFDVQIAAGSSYDVTVATQPINEICTVANAKGTVDSSGDAVNGIVVSCVTTL